VLVRPYMADSPKSCTLLQQACIGGKNVLFELFEVLHLAQKCGPAMGLNKLAVEMSWVFNCLVLLRQDLNSENNRVQKELTQYRSAVRPSLQLLLENKADAVFHYEESALLVVSSESVSDLLVDLRHRP
jgi:hypothetical protein